MKGQTAINHEGKNYQVSDEKPQNGDLVLTEKYGVWKKNQAKESHEFGIKERNEEEKEKVFFLFRFNLKGISN